MVIWETERLDIKEIEISEAEEACELLSLFNSGENFDRDKVLAYIKVAYGFYGYGYWGVYLKTGELIGLAGFREGSSPLEIGYAISGEYRNKGYASEAVAALTEFAVEEFGWVIEEQDSEEGKKWAYDKLHEAEDCENVYYFDSKDRPLIYAKVRKDNVASERVLLKNGFKKSTTDQKIRSKVMKKGEIYEGTVKELHFPNKGIVIADGEKCMVKNVIPGQKVRFRVTRKRHDDAEGQLLDVIEKAENEAVIPNCPHYGVCGGCAFHTLSYEDQLKTKEKEVLDLLKDIKGYEYLGAFGSPDRFEYKNKMEFSFGDECLGGELSLGLHKKGSFYDVIPVPGCRIVHEDIRKILVAVLDECRAEGLTYYHKMKHVGLLRHLMVRRSVSTGEILLGLVTTSDPAFDPAKIMNVVLSLNLKGSIAGFLHIINDLPADTVQAERIDVLYGRDWFYEELLGLKFKVTPFSFFQTNSKGAEVLYGIVRSLIDDASEEEKNTVFDLYSGTGTIAQIVSPVCKKIIGVEIVPEAVEAARENVKLNGITNCEFIAGDVLKVLDEIETKPDFIILDPPRDGIHPKALPKLLSYGVQNMIYVSCKPTSLARDLPFFESAGYRVKKLAICDMFPWTTGVETVVLLNKNFSEAKDRLQIGIDAEEYYKAIG